MKKIGLIWTKSSRECMFALPYTSSITRASLLDVIVEGQDLEKFSVFYRFARFHGRGQSSGAESSSTDASAHSHKPFLQRYVTAFPMPQNLPDRPLATSMPGFSLVTPASGKEWSHIKPGFEIYMNAKGV
ncbi:hypothetical protein KY290_018801 [Solanum tuberosum]|uniref:Uncharacterized protein n=1 Tax=Solanum tuberosum TaxID=4113 RepID=A0ABQ7VHC5_SOLTU|nr:hypothetical protein KY290_018801 [Solanum tuberosum]